MSTARNVRTNLMDKMESAGYVLRHGKGVTSDAQLGHESIGLGVGDIRECAPVLTPADENRVIGISLRSAYVDSAYQRFVGAPQ